MNFEDDATDLDYVYDETDPGVKRMDMSDFKDAINTGIRKQWSSQDMMLIINQTLAAVNREDKFLSRQLIDSWKDELGNQAKNDHEQKYTNIKCLTFDGKTSETSIGHNQVERKHHLTFVVEPECKYLEHVNCGETGAAMAMAIIDVIDATNSGESCDTLGAGKFILINLYMFNLRHDKKTGQMAAALSVARIQFRRL